jgi:DNA-binding LacI/PurR family transcriptional regulator
LKRATISDVATRAGVSKATVSHVINATRFVEQMTKQRVLNAIEELGYRPSMVARSLTTNQTNTVGVLVSDTSNNFYAEILLGIESSLRPAGYGLIVCNTAETRELELGALDLLLSQRVDGLLVAGATRQWDPLNRAEAEQLPIVFVDREFEGLTGPFVGIDNELAAHAGTRCLIEAGHEDLGLVVGQTPASAMRGRVAGFRRAAQECDLTIREDWIMYCQSQVDAACEAVERLFVLPNHPTALLVTNNVMVLGVLRGFKTLGLRCPEDVSLVGFDDNPWWDVTSPPLTAVLQPSRHLGREAGELLLAIMRGEEPAKRRIVLPCELVERDSVAPPATVRRKQGQATGIG